MCFNKACVTWKTRLEDKIHVLRDVRHPVWSQHLNCVTNVAGSVKESAPKQDESHTFGQLLFGWCHVLQGAATGSEVG